MARNIVTEILDKLESKEYTMFTLVEFQDEDGNWNRFTDADVDLYISQDDLES
jgi:hypothetical protein